MADGCVSVEPKKVGRPPAYQPKFCDRIIELGAMGYSQARMAADIGVAKQTISEWAKRYPEFLDALTRARTLSQSWWESQAQDGLKNREFNTPLYLGSMKSMFRDDYTDRTINELVGKDDGPIALSDTGADARKIAFMLGRAMGRLDARQKAESHSNVSPESSG